MDPFSLEFSAHRVAGSDRIERTFHSRVEMVYPDSHTRVHLQGAIFPNQMLSLQLSSFQVVRPGLLTATMLISDVNGQTVSNPRPVLINALACDVPLYSTHIGADPDFGVFSVGIRSPRAGWLATEETGAEEQST